MLWLTLGNIVEGYKGEKEFTLNVLNELNFGG